MTHRFLLLSLILGVIIASSSRAPAQALPTINRMTMGRLFVLTFPDTTTTKFDPQHPPTFENQFQAYVYSPVDNVVHVKGSSGTPVEYDLKRGTFTTIDFPNDQIEPRNAVQSNNTYRIEADYPVLIYCYMLTSFGGEAWTPLPVEAWGTEYYAAALPGEIVRNALPQDAGFIWYETKAAPAEIAIVAAFDDTHISIYKHGELEGYPKLINVDLRANQVYMVQSYVDTNAVATGAPQSDLGATKILSDKPVGVISGNTRAGVLDIQDGLLQNSYKNMLIEWLSPERSFGRGFAYLPTWDEYRPTGAPGEDLTEKRSSESVRIYAPDEQEATNGYICDGTSGGGMPFSVAPGEFYEERFDVPVPHCVTTNSPAQSMMTSSPAFNYQGAATEGAGASYRAYTGPYMVTMVPRERWTSVAPFFTPLYPDLSKHYVNVVTDSTSRTKVLLKVLGPTPHDAVPFTFNRGMVPGTDLVWGTMQLEAGTAYYLTGTDSSVQFSGFVYGGFSGYEIYDPVRGPANLPQYNERVATSYGYPLASRNIFVGPSDSLDIQSDICCCTMMSVKIRTLNANPVGLHSIELENAENARIKFIDPNRSEFILARTVCEFSVDMIDPSKDASAMLVITDRSGRQTRIPFMILARKLDTAPHGAIDFGEIQPGQHSIDTTITICNPRDVPIKISEIRFARGNQRFELTNKNILPQALDAHGCIQVTVSYAPDTQHRVSDDSLVIETDCPPTFGVALHAETVEPCIAIDDLPFGVIDRANPEVANGKTLPLKICNQGSGTVRFEDQGKGLISWLDKNHFSIDQSSVDLLRDAALGPGACMTISVTFTPTDTGTFQTVGRFWANTRECRDTSIWSAIVIQSAPLDAPSTGDAIGYSLRGNLPNPFTGITRIEFSLGRSAPTRVEIFDAAGQRLTTLADETMSAGPHRMLWDASSIPSGIYFCRVSSGSWSQSIPMTLLR